MAKLGQVIILQSHSSVIAREHLLQWIQLSHAKQASSIWANGGFSEVSSQVSSIRQFARMRFDSALSLWCGRMSLGCCSCGLATLQVLLVPAAGLTHQGMRQDTAGRKQQAGNETAWKAGQPTPFFSIQLAIRAVKAPWYSCRHWYLKTNISSFYYLYTYSINLSASLHLLCVAHFPQMTWDKATNLAAVARGGACSASGNWLILRTYKVMGWGRGGKRLYRSCTWGEGKNKEYKPHIHCTEQMFHAIGMVYFHQCHHCCSLTL